MGGQGAGCQESEGGKGGGQIETPGEASDTRIVRGIRRLAQQALAALAGWLRMTAGVKYGFLGHPVRNENVGFVGGLAIAVGRPD